MERSSAAMLTAMLFFTAIANAQNPDTPSISFNSYGTFGVVHSNEERAEFIPELSDPEGVGASGDWSAEVDSRLGLQLTVNITPKLSAVVQGVAEQRYDDTWTPTLEWANLKYQFTPDFYIRAGRMVLPSFITSDYRKVGYAIPWVRPPPELYRLLPVTNTDGVEASYRFRIGEFTNTLRVLYGGKDTKSPDNVESEAQDAWTVSNILEYGDATLHTAYSNARITISALNPLFDAFRQFGPAGETIADRYDVDGKRIELISVGARYDPGDWFLMGEWARSESRTFIGTLHGWYVTGGYRYRSFTPYFTYASVDIKSNTSDPGLPVAGLPPPVAAGAQGLNAVLNGILGSSPKQDTLTMGARWDFHQNMALKVQYDYIDLGSGSPGILTNEQPGFNRGGSVSLFSATIDFVF